MVEGIKVSPTKLSTMLNIDIGATCLQEASAPDPLPEFASKKQFNGMLHSLESSDQCNLQHNQILTMGQEPNTTPAQSFTLQVGGILLLL